MTSMYYHLFHQAGLYVQLALLLALQSLHGQLQVIRLRGANLNTIFILLVLIFFVNTPGLLKVATLVIKSIGNHKYKKLVPSSRVKIRWHPEK